MCARMWFEIQKMGLTRLCGDLFGIPKDWNPFKHRQIELGSMSDRFTPKPNQCNTCPNLSKTLRYSFNFCSVRPRQLSNAFRNRLSDYDKYRQSVMRTWTCSVLCMWLEWQALQESCCISMASRRESGWQDEAGMGSVSDKLDKSNIKALFFYARYMSSLYMLYGIQNTKVYTALYCTIPWYSH
jgi:hypothetical protein